MTISDQDINECLQKCVHATQLPYTPQEEARLLQRFKAYLNHTNIEDRHDEAFYRQQLENIRLHHWEGELRQYARKRGIFWLVAPFIEQFVMSIEDLNCAHVELINRFHKQLLHRFILPFDSPQDAYNGILEEAESDEHVLSTHEKEALLTIIAEAFHLSASQREELAQQRQKELDAQVAQIRKAQRRRQAEDEKLKAWEDSLVTYEELPRILRASRREILQWLAQKRIPVARKTRDENAREIWEFDPRQLTDLLSLIPSWRKKRNPKSVETLTPDMGRDIANSTLAQIAGMDQYAAHFSMARAIKRRITLVTGPTNSGKSHIALQALANAQTGVALAPLRLLAHEFRDTLSQHQVISSLSTGEERVIDPRATHICATVEMCPFSKAFDVALIDEAQMLFDPQRGAAWTAALMGVAANHIYVLGAPDCIPMVRRIAQLCADDIDYVSLERKSPLRAASSAVKMNKIQQGDAIIAFSRREVLDLRAILLAQGHRVSVVYGALSPEVRKAEAQCFNSGKSDILVATDAIGMGLNLSIRRIIFAALQKYDGQEMRPLTSQEVKQIGGRAGRYGRHEEGIVAVLKGQGPPSFIQKMLNAPPYRPRDLRPYVQPDLSIVRAIAREIHSTSLYGVLSRIYRAVLRKDDPNYRMADMEQAFEIASCLEAVDGLELSVRWSYAMCPVDQRNNGISRLIFWARRHGQKLTVAPPKLGFLPQAAHASRFNLEKAEKKYKVFLAWRWLALRFPETYISPETATNHVRYLNGWIEKVLRKQSSARQFKKDKQFKKKQSPPKKASRKHHKKRNKGRKGA